LLVIALVVGVASGIFAVMFYHLINGFNAFFFGQAKALGGPAFRYLFPLVGGLGGLLVGPIVYFLAREAKGHGVPEVMHAVALQGGRIRPRVVVVKALASAITIGSGGSAGREGPIAQIGAAIGSTIGQFFRMSEERLKTLVAAGAGAGIAATFNTPIAGALFALEVVLGEFSASTFSLVLVSSVSAAALARLLLGDSPAFLVAQYEMVAPVELFFYFLLGLVAALVAQAYTRILYRTEDIFDSLKKVPEYLRPAIGGIAFGAMAILLPQTLGRGESVMHSMLDGSMSLVWLLALLAVAKILTTSLTIGSGGSGGIFFPGLYIGAASGGFAGVLFHSLFPGVTAGSGAYALVGMGAVFAGMTQAPLTAIIMLFEMTMDYRIILPLMLACGVSSLLASTISGETIYTMKLVRRGINIKAGKDVNVMRSIKVAEAMSTRVNVVRDDMTIGEVIPIMQETRHNGFPVVDHGGHLKGIITLSDIRGIDIKRRLQTPVAEAMTTNLIVATPDETLDDVLKKLAFRDVGRLPVVDNNHRNKLVGVITRSDIIKAYNRKLVEVSLTSPQSSTG